MIFSMTGFASAATELDFGSLAVELRAVNHRYLDLQVRMPDELRMLEPMLREILAAGLTRGKVECRVAFSARQSGQNPAQINLSLVQLLAQWSREPIAADLVRQALREFTEARRREGEKMQDFLQQRIEQIETLCATVAPRIPAAIAAYEEKLAARLQTVLQTGEDERLRQEITLFASKIDVDEELTRLQAHLTEMKRVLAKGGVAGKRLDFLMQELHREANTLGAKSVDAEVSRVSMEMKLIIEQMREQIQNIE